MEVRRVPSRVREPGYDVAPSARVECDDVLTVGVEPCLCSLACHRGAGDIDLYGLVSVAFCCRNDPVGAHS